MEKASGIIEMVLKDQVSKLRAKQQRQTRTLQITTDQLIALEEELRSKGIKVD